MHDNVNDLIDEHVDDQENFQIKISSARKHYYNHNDVVNTFPSCISVLPGEDAGDYISVVAPVGLVFVKNISSTSSGFFFILASERPRTVRLIAGKCQRHAEKEAAVQRTS